MLFVSGLLHAERRRLGTTAGTRSLGCYRQAILVLDLWWSGKHDNHGGNVQVITA